MAAGVNSTGFETKTFETILTDITTRANLPENYGVEFPTTPDSIFGILSNIIAASLKDQWDLVGNVSDQQNRDKAEGKFLDDLAALTGLSRLLSAGSSGTLEYTGTNGTTVPFGTPAKTIADEIVVTQAALTLDRTACHGSIFSVALLQNNTTYTITVGGTTHDFVSDSDATALEIAQGFVTLIGTQATYEATLGTDPETFEINLLNNTNNVLTTTNSANLALDEVRANTQALAVVQGAVIFLANAINILGSTIAGITAVNNPAAFVLGRLEETDEELRERMAVTTATTSAATKPAIEARVQQISGVSNALITENTGTVVDGGGRPPKSYEMFVNGGTDEDIADVLWITKPAGIETFGTIAKVIVDANGDNQTVNFSRFINKSGWVRITYILNAEETFPVDGEAQISQAVADFGNLFAIGDDIIPNKFFEPAYSVKGATYTLIEIAITDLPTDTPTYQTTTIAIDQSTVVDFDPTRVPVSL